MPEHLQKFGKIFLAEGGFGEAVLNEEEHFQPTFQPLGNEQGFFLSRNGYVY